MDKQANPVYAGTIRDSFPARCRFLQNPSNATSDPLARFSKKLRPPRAHSIKLRCLHLQDHFASGCRNEALKLLHPRRHLGLDQQSDVVPDLRTIEASGGAISSAARPALNSAAATSLAERTTPTPTLLYRASKEMWRRLGAEKPSPNGADAISQRNFNKAAPSHFSVAAQGLPKSQPL